MRICKAYLVNHVPQRLYVNLAQKPRASLLFLHGGPGWSDAPWAHLTCAKLWDHFNIIHWDQRGTNRSYSSTLDSSQMTVKQLILDGIEVVKVLQTEFGIHKPILVGHSWGSMLGVLLSMHAPELFHSFIGIGQLVANSQSELLSLDYCKKTAQTRNRLDLLSEIESMGESFYKDRHNLFRQREILFELGGEFKTPISLETLTNWMMNAPADYQSSWEIMYDSCVFSMDHLWNEVIHHDLNLECKSFDIPITILQGKHDFCTVSSVAFKWFKNLKAKQKQFIWFENSAHWPQLEENEKWTQFLLTSS